jgi:hypothetical protein
MMSGFPREAVAASVLADNGDGPRCSDSASGIARCPACLMSEAASRQIGPTLESPCQFRVWPAETK